VIFRLPKFTPYSPVKFPIMRKYKYHPAHAPLMLSKGQSLSSSIPFIEGSQRESYTVQRGHPYFRESIRPGAPFGHLLGVVPPGLEGVDHLPPPLPSIPKEVGQ